MNGIFLISQSDKRPMYIQIMEQIKQKIALGDWTQGQTIPSIRQLAVDLEVSVITVKRAYLELEREGIIVTHHGRGSYVAENSDLGTKIREQELAQHFEQAARIGAQLGLDSTELATRLSAACDQLQAAQQSTEEELV
jgi:GntR family transcriptional regulator